MSVPQILREGSSISFGNPGLRPSDKPRVKPAGQGSPKCTGKICEKWSTTSFGGFTFSSCDYNKEGKADCVPDNLTRS
jgi:hypothetical protein